MAVVWIVIGIVGVAHYVSDYNVTRGFVRIQRSAGAPAGTLRWVHFVSTALGRRAGYIVYLPPGYTAHRHYPVLYLLHGMPGMPELYVSVGNVDVRADNLIQQHQMPPMIIVMPDGRINGSASSDSEWANTPAGNYESYVIDVVHNVDARFASIPSRDARVIAGYSAGGLGALNLALHHLDIFGAVEVWSGAFGETPVGVFAGATPAQTRYYSPMEYVARLRPAVARYPLTVFIYAGRGDGTSKGVRPLAAALRRVGIASTGIVYHGGHDWQLWIDRFSQMLVLAGSDVQHAVATERAAPPGPAATSPAHRRTVSGAR